MHVLFSNIFANASRKRKCFSLIFKIPGEADLSNTVITRPNSLFYCFFSNRITENNELIQQQRAGNKAESASKVI
jgi:hypothetical protein